MLTSDKEINMSYSKIYDQQMEQVNARFNDWINQATSSYGSKADDAEKEKRLREEGFTSYITPEKQEVWIPRPEAPTSAIQDYQKGFSSMSPETIKEVYPMLQYVQENFFPVVDQLHDAVKNNEISLQFVQEKIIAMILEGTKEAIDKTGGMSKQGNSAVAKASSNAQAVATYAKSPKAGQQVLLGGDNE